MVTVTPFGVVLVCTYGLDEADGGTETSAKTAKGTIAIPRIAAALDTLKAGKMYDFFMLIFMLKIGYDL